MQLNIKVIKKWQRPHFYINPPFQGYAPFLAKFLVLPQVTQFFEGPTPRTPTMTNIMNLNFESQNYVLFIAVSFYQQDLRFS